MKRIRRILALCLIMGAIFLSGCTPETKPAPTNTPTPPPGFKPSDAPGMFNGGPPKANPEPNP